MIGSLRRGSIGRHTGRLEWWLSPQIRYLDLAVYLAGRSTVPATDPERLRIALYQVHLPRLVRADVIEDADEHDRISLRRPGDALLPLLDVVDAWSRR